jgi:hypothetical protein
VHNWKSLYIFYISGTGNARASSEWIADEADKRVFLLNALPFWRRYNFIKENKNRKNSLKP